MSHGVDQFTLVRDGRRVEDRRRRVHLAASDVSVPRGGRCAAIAPLMIRLLAIDIDGTLLDGRGRLPDAHRDAIVEASARGIEIALVTGRSFPFHAGGDRPPARAAHAHRQQRRGGEAQDRRDRVAARARPGGGAAHPRRDATPRGQRRGRVRPARRAPDRVRADGLDAPEPARLLREEQGVHRRRDRHRSPTC